MKILEQIKKWIFQWIGIILILWISSITYATWVNITQVNNWEVLDASTINNLIDNQKDLDTRLNAINTKSLATAWVNFDWTNCTWWAWLNECIIRDSFNISKVIRNSIWQYTVNFSTPMINVNYSAVAAMSLVSSSAEHPYVKNYTSTWVSIILAHSSFIDQANVSLQVFWWK